MKRVVVVGASGYIGRRFCDYARDSILIEAASSRDGAWKSAHFGSADSVLFAEGNAGMAENLGGAWQINPYL